MTKKTLAVALCSLLGLTSFSSPAFGATTLEKTATAMSNAFSVQNMLGQYAGTHTFFSLLESENMDTFFPTTDGAFLYTPKGTGFTFSAAATKRFDNFILNGSAGYDGVHLNDFDDNKDSGKQSGSDSKKDESSSAGGFHIAGNAVYVVQSRPGLGVTAGVSLLFGTTTLYPAPSVKFEYATNVFSLTVGAIQQYTVNEGTNWTVGANLSIDVESAEKAKLEFDDGYALATPAFENKSLGLNLYSQMKFKDLLDMVGLNVDWDAALGLRSVDPKMDASDLGKDVVQRLGENNQAIFYVNENKEGDIKYATSKQSLSNVTFQTEVRASYTIGIVDLMASVRMGYNNVFFGGVGFGLGGNF